MPIIKAEINKDESGFPARVIVSEGGKRLELTYNKDAGYTLKGKMELLEAMRLIFPFTDPKSPQTLVETGRIIQREVNNLAGADVVMYTVPVGHAFYLLQYDLDVEITVAALSEGNLHFFDTLNQCDFALIRASRVLHEHTQGSFLMFKMPPNWQIHGYSFGSAVTNATITGVEI